MNKRKGFFRLTIILSVLVGVIFIFLFYKPHVVSVKLPKDWTDKSLEERLGSMHKLLTDNFTYLNLTKSKQPKIVEQLREKILSDKTIWTRNYVPGYYVMSLTNWEVLGIAFFSGFISVWFLYVFIRWVVIGFIIRGFKNKSNP